MNEVTRLLVKLDQGDATAADELLPLVYHELRRLAERKLRHEKPGQTLQATALVHEAYIRLVDKQDSKCWDNRIHFLGAAAEAMRRIMIESARKRHSEKHGGQWNRIDVDDQVFDAVERSSDLLELDLALKELADVDPQKARLVTLRYFGGLSLEESAKALGISRATASRYWTFAKAWLYDRLKGPTSEK